MTKTFAGHHPANAPLFGTDFGRNLMFTESHILLATFQQLMAEDVPALPIHDETMVPTAKLKTARKAMEDAAELVTGVSFVVSAER